MLVSIVVISALRLFLNPMLYCIMIWF